MGAERREEKRDIRYRSFSSTVGKLYVMDDLICIKKKKTKNKKKVVVITIISL